MNICPFTSPLHCILQVITFMSISKKVHFCTFTFFCFNYMAHLLVSGILPMQMRDTFAHSVLVLDTPAPACQGVVKNLTSFKFVKQIFVPH